MHLASFYGPGKFGLSFELFPPKTEAGEAALFRAVAELLALRPSFVTCTYGAGGSTRHKTLDIVERVRKEHGCAVAAHLTCVGSSVEELRQFLSEAQRRGIGNLVALRGDPPRGEVSFRPVAGGLAHANELVALIRREFSAFGLAVAGYPEKHVEAPSFDVDLANLKRKVEAGADVVITQLFYDNEDFFRFRDQCAAAGIRVPIVPGLLPVTNFAQVKRITSLCGAKLPAAFLARLEAQGEDEAGQFAIGVEAAARQTTDLIAAGVPGIHFYVLNKSQAVTAVLQAVGPRGVCASRPDPMEAKS